MHFKKSLLTISTATLLFGATPAFAGGLVLGVKGGAYKPDIKGVKPTLMASAQIAYEFLDLVAADIAVELEYSRNLSSGKTDISAITVDYQNIGAYISTRTAGPLYAIGRIGVANATHKFKSPLGDVSKNKTGVAVGAGFGFSLGARTEIEVTRYELPDSKQSYYLSIGASF